MSPEEFWFFVIGIFALLALFLLSIFIPSMFYAFAIIAIVVAAVIFFITFVKKYSQFERGIIFRLGKFNRIAGPGWAIVVPFFEEEYKKVDVRVKMVDITSSDIFTADDLKISLEGTIYYQIIDPEKATLQIDNYGQGLSNLVQSAIRNAIASLTMRQVFGSLDRLNDILADAIRHMTWKWGIDVPSVQLR